MLRAPQRQANLTAIATVAMCCALGCGPGIHSSLGVGVSTTETTRVIDRNGDTITLAQATLVLGPGTVTDPTPITLRQIPSIAHSGAYGPIFEISVPAPNLLAQDPLLELRVPDIGANQMNLVLGVLDPSLPLDAVQWIPISGSRLDTSVPAVIGPVQGFTSTSTLQFGAVVRCPAPAGCPAGQACNSGACQQCPTGSCS
jgi:hypothetical protein